MKLSSHPWLGTGFGVIFRALIEARLRCKQVQMRFDGNRAMIIQRNSAIKKANDSNYQF
jgi:hypothetical protein